MTIPNISSHHVPVWSNPIKKNPTTALPEIWGQTSGDPSDVIPAVEEEEEAEVQVSRLSYSETCPENERLFEAENGEWKRRNIADIISTIFWVQNVSFSGCTLGSRYMAQSSKQICRGLVFSNYYLENVPNLLLPWWKGRLFSRWLGSIFFPQDFQLKFWSCWNDRWLGKISSGWSVLLERLIQVWVIGIQLSYCSVMYVCNR